MSFDLAEIQSQVARHGRVIRVVVAEARGSVPREAGATMLLWDGGQSGTIGGGALEHEATLAAKAGRRGLSRHPLGPSLGQCCGGHVTLWTEVWDEAALAGLDVSSGVVTRGAAGVPPRLPAVIGGLLVEAVSGRDPLWIWGAGHVGRALVGVLGPLPQFGIVWVDVGEDRFPDEAAPGVDRLWGDPVALAGAAPEGAGHLILTHSHDLDLALCHALLGRQTRSIGLIGSATKWRRFRSRLAALGHSAAAIDGIECPIGDPSLGKHPQAIAVGVAAAILGRRGALAERGEAV